MDIETLGEYFVEEEEEDLRTETNTLELSNLPNNAEALTQPTIISRINDKDKEQAIFFDDRSKISVPVDFFLQSNPLSYGKPEDSSTSPMQTGAKKNTDEVPLEVIDNSDAREQHDERNYLQEQNICILCLKFTSCIKPLGLADVELIGFLTQIDVTTYQFPMVACLSCCTKIENCKQLKKQIINAFNDMIKQLGNSTVSTARSKSENCFNELYQIKNASQATNTCNDKRNKLEAKTKNVVDPNTNNLSAIRQSCCYVKNYTKEQKQTEADSPVIRKYSINSDNETNQSITEVQQISFRNDRLTSIRKEFRVYIRPQKSTKDPESRKMCENEIGDSIVLNFLNQEKSSESLQEPNNTLQLISSQSDSMKLIEIDLTEERLKVDDIAKQNYFKRSTDNETRLKRINDNIATDLLDLKRLRGKLQRALKEADVTESLNLSSIVTTKNLNFKKSLERKCYNTRKSFKDSIN